MRSAMKTLAIETSCEQASVALRIGTTSIARVLSGHANHSEGLLPSVATLLAEAGLRVADLDCVAFGAGPGAFTGLRLACGAAQGLAMGGGIGVVPVPTLAALAADAPDGNVIALTDARMGEIYTAAYFLEAGCPVPLHAAACLAPNAFELPEGQERWWLLGSALKAWPDLLERLPAARVSGVDAQAVPQAESVARLAEGIAAREGMLAPELAVPLYVRDKVAMTTAERLARGGRA